MRPLAAGLATAIFLTANLAGCLDGDQAKGIKNLGAGLGADTPFLGYKPAEPDAGMAMRMFDLFPSGSTGNLLHARVVMPPGAGPFATIVEATPYTAPGCNTGVASGSLAVEPPVGVCRPGTFEKNFVARGYVFVRADLRGTGDSNDCLNLRGQKDINDIGALADAIAAQPWSNGNVGFIGASYPGSTSHMAALSGSAAVKAVVPVVASTSFYHYHHYNGVPYNGQHSLGGTNTGYLQQANYYTYNPASFASKLKDQPHCPHVENAVTHGGFDQTGDYYAWWQERNLRSRAREVTVPVLMAQGLADWNVKPDHIATWFNELGSTSKTFIGGQWGHAFPRSATKPSDCPAYSPSAPACDPHIPWGDWWAYASAFFDTFLKEIDTGMFQGSVAWVQDNNGTWHRSTTFPLQGTESASTTMFLNRDGLGLSPTDPGTLSWHACPRDRYTMGHLALRAIEGATVRCANTQLVFESAPLPTDMLLSGVPLLNLTVDVQGKKTHLVAVLDVIDGKGNVVRARENFGYLNTRFHAGFPKDSAVPSGFFPTTIDFYPQEDRINAGERLRLTLRSHDEGRSIEHFQEGDITIKVGGADGASLFLPLRPNHMTGVRLD